MAKDDITGLVMCGGVLEWTALRPVRETVEVSGSSRVTLVEAGSTEIADRLREACRDVSGTVSLAIGSEHVLLRVMELPTVNDEELASMVALQIDKFCPFPVETMVTGFEVLKREGTVSRVLIGAVRKEVVDEQGVALKEAGLSIDRVDATVLGWCELLQRAGEIGHEGRQVVVLLDEAVPEVIVFDEGLPVTFRSLGACQTLSGEAWETELAHEIGYTLLTSELEHGGAVTRRVSVWTRESDARGVVTHIQDECGCDVHMKSLDELGSVSEGIAHRAWAGRGMDLTPPAWREAEHHRRFRKRMTMAVAVVAGVWLFGAVVVWGGTAIERAREAAFSREQTRWREPALEVRELRRRVSIVKRYMDRTDSALEYLRAVSEVLPPGVELTSFSYRKGEELRLSGEADTVEQVYAFKNELDVIELFRGESVLQGPRSDRQKRKELFDIVMELSETE